jgi:hypothetical protein
VKIDFHLLQEVSQFLELVGFKCLQSLG